MNYDFRYPQLTRAEIRCKCGKCNYDTIPMLLADLFMSARLRFAEPIIITSACRCVQHNRTVGGSATSSHLHGLALDLHPRDNTEYKRQVLAYCLGMAGFQRIGINTNRRFIHVDIDSGKPHAIFNY
jgi:uncharacterized protein YcbK (DUF882 family)